ncbi:FCS-Like Zinc finger 13-like [Aristolochia californica]|uniref:FCS-Like Zinc finger 13-like n=1 Tax=Aristolochia californica TaxID=171875 RepID=UPI0035D8E535
MMLGKKRSRDPVRRILEPIVPGDRLGFSEAATSPTSPIEIKVGSPNKWRNRESQGIGLGIIAALQKSEEVQGKFVLSSLNLSQTDPIPVGSGKNSARVGGVYEKSEVGSSESYTSVTFRGPQPTVTRVYFECNEVSRRIGSEFQKNIDDRKSRNKGLFWASPPRFAEDFTGFPTSDFLSCCNLCWKKLNGRDIYMYRGEKAFCSAECRYRQIISDEHKEKCRAGVSEISSSSYTDILISPGIAAA